MKLDFIKMHGCGNDYVYMDCTAGIPFDVHETAIRLSVYHKGIGSDGMILICRSAKADFRMRMFNADGSEGEMCGNGIRCVGKFIYDNGLSDKTELHIETGIHSDEDSDAGNYPEEAIKTLWLTVTDGKVSEVTVDMAAPITEPERIPVEMPDMDGSPIVNRDFFIEEKNWPITCISMGNPHAVTFVQDVASLDLPAIGPLFETHPVFPRRVNTEFIQPLARNELKMRVWERGSGETQACGTGACASAVAAIMTGLADPDTDITVHLLGGDLKIRLDTASGHVLMTGEAVTVFTGTIEL